MNMVTRPSVLSGTLDELLDKFMPVGNPDSVPSRVAEIKQAFSGELITQPRFRIPGADKESDIFFNSRELLCRFVSLPTPTQTDFIKAAKTAMTEKEVRDIEVEIPWTKTRTRKLRVRASGMTGNRSLDIDLA